jgi:hypothetical protein
MLTLKTILFICLEGYKPSLSPALGSFFMFNSANIFENSSLPYICSRDGINVASTRSSWPWQKADHIYTYIIYI